MSGDFGGGNSGGGNSGGGNSGGGNSGGGNSGGGNSGGGNSGGATSGHTASGSAQSGFSQGLLCGWLIGGSGGTAGGGSGSGRQGARRDDQTGADSSGYVGMQRSSETSCGGLFNSQYPCVSSFFFGTPFVTFISLTTYHLLKNYTYSRAHPGQLDPYGHDRLMKLLAFGSAGTGIVMTFCAFILCCLAKQNRQRASSFGGAGGVLDAVVVFVPAIPIMVGEPVLSQSSVERGGCRAPLDRMENGKSGNTRADSLPNGNLYPAAM